MEKFTTSDAGKGMLSAMEDKGYMGLGYWSSGLKQFSANKPLILPTDAAGLKFRVQTSDVAVAMINALDAAMIEARLFPFSGPMKPEGCAHWPAWGAMAARMAVREPAGTGRIQLVGADGKGPCRWTGPRAKSSGLASRAPTASAA